MAANPSGKYRKRGNGSGRSRSQRFHVVRLALAAAQTAAVREEGKKPPEERNQDPVSVDSSSASCRGKPSTVRR